LGLPLAFVDERLSSVHAERSMRDAGAGSREVRTSVDMVAASILLQGYLDAQAAPAADGETS
ncbi:MAG TPA: Holliday junction resolvase RuvX, partial [Coriobacteriia bacterium]